ncbi:recombinase family protein [Microbacterium sp. ET2]|uniref:recombinase family protein n=1 Tax=Microbacterium albipurpureum TaxID=3050384 RepID=UPI00259D03F9|nr:recombinase family protein [Microbacterium sp. ET2 (Ac-2212)]WJL95872.1 recombinase family protein [Microbacterium sp. ET2 (Ac-2212)]
MTSTQPPRAVIYCRISDDPTGRAAGVDRQRDECAALADTKGVEVIDTLVDNDLSATTGKRRPGFERVLEMIRAGRIDTIVVWHTDRLYRLPRDLEPIIALAEGRRLRFLTVTASEIDLNTPSGRMVARMLAAASAQEVEHKADRQRSAADQRAAKGLPTARPGYGYRRVDGHDVINKDEAAVITEAARRVLNGESLRSIVADYKLRAIPSPAGAPWQPVTLRQLIQRPSLTGLRTHRGKVVGDFDPSLHPAILDRDTHDRLVAFLTDPTRKTANVGHPPKHLLSGIAMCGLCGDTLGGKMKRLPPWTPKLGQKSKPVKAAYACDTCHKVRRLQEPVDEFVTEVLLRRLERDDAAELFTTGDADAAREARDAIAAVNARLASAADLFADGAIDAAQLERITARGRADRKQLERELAAALPPALPTEAVGERAREVWATLDPERRRAIVSALMRVTIMPAGSGTSFNPELVRIEWVSDTG